MEAERQSRVRLGQRLEALRPQTSSQQRQAAAEATGTLFDVVSQSVGWRDLLLHRVAIVFANFHCVLMYMYM